MEKWKKEIEDVLSDNRTVDRWIIRDFAWSEDNPIPKLMLSMRHLMTAMNLLCTGPDAMSEPELKERIRESLTVAGLSQEAVDQFLALLERHESIENGNRPEEAGNEDKNEPLGDGE